MFQYNLIFFGILLKSELKGGRIVRKNRRVICYIAMSLDGYIAEKDGGIDWLHEMESVGEGDNGYEDFYDRIDTVLMGKKTYDQVMSFVQEFPYPGKKAYVFSRSTTGQDKHVEYVNEDIGSFTESLREKAGLDIWMGWGGAISFMILLKKD